MKRNPFETILGAIVLVTALGFLGFALNKVDVETIKGYELKVKFNKSTGLVKGADVRISGIKVGSISDIILDEEDFTAVATLVLKDTIKLKQGTVAVVTSDGLMGGKYLKLEPAKSGEALLAGAMITKTKEYKSLEDTVGELIFLATE